MNEFWPCADTLLRPRLRYCPVVPSIKQRTFCVVPVLDAFYGGAAGGAKSWGLLMAALQFVDVPGYAALLIRNTYQDLALPNALIDVSRQWLDGTDAHWDGQNHRWNFPSGASLSFGYLDGPYDHLRYKSAAFQFVGIDEASEIREEQATFMFSRIRKPNDVSGLKASPDGLTLDQVPLRFRCTSNPGGLYPRWVYDRYINEESRAEHAAFIPAKLEDNPYLDRDSYEQSMKMMGNEILFQQLRHGVWDLSPAGAMFNKDKLKLADEPLLPGVRRVRFWDIAGTEENPSNPDPDRTAGILLAKHEDGSYRVEDLQWFAKEPAETKRLIRQTAELDTHDVPVAIEAIGMGKIFFDDYKRTVLNGFEVYQHTFKGSGPKDKATRARMVASAWNNELMSWVVKQNTRKAIDEVCSFGAQGYKGHDDVVDSLSGAFNWLNARKPVDFAAATGTL